MLNVLRVSEVQTLDALDECADAHKWTRLLAAQWWEGFRANGGAIVDIILSDPELTRIWKEERGQDEQE